MELIFTKRAGKYDDLVIRRNGIDDATMRCPKQGIIPHDMVHFAVESMLEYHGFLSLIDKGQPAEFTTRGGDGEEAIERLVEVFQAELWGGRIPAAELIETYELACGARGHGSSAVSADQVEAIRARLDSLTNAWAEVPMNGSLDLRF